ncbi:MAG: rhomboid family intramembrane serine protease [Anaerovoracaceae bacterium]
MARLNGSGEQDAGNEGKIITMPTLAERDRLRRDKEKAERTLRQEAEPLINMPPVTKWLLIYIVGIHFISSVILSPDLRNTIIDLFGFVPQRLREGSNDPFALLSPLTHIFLHGGWMHVIMNAFMLAAFGSGIEKWLGSRRMLILFIASAFFGVATHYILNTTSPYPMIGASGGLSGLFAAAIVMINRGQREMGGRIGILPFALLWVGLSVAFGMLGGPDGSIIAWAAHVGGFLGGFAVLKFMKA